MLFLADISTFALDYKGMTATIKNIWNYRFLILQLIRIFALSPYKKSYLGGLWLLLFPFITVIIWVFLHGAGIVNPGETGVPYPVYVLLSTSIWALFIQIYRSVSQAISNGGKMMMMNKFPHETIVVSLLITQLFNFFILFLLNIGIILLFKVPLTWYVLLFPLTIIPLVLFALSIGLLVALLRIVALDVCQLIDEGMKVLMYLTPIVYAPRISISWLQPIIDWNPLTYLIGFSRDVLLSGTLFEPKAFAICTVIVLCLFPLVLRFYLKSVPFVIERIINN